MIQHVYERASAASNIDAVIVATEDERIGAACAEFGAPFELTSSLHRSGTDRIAEVAQRHPEFDIVLNVQGDEPAIEPETISAVALAFSAKDVTIASAVTLAHPTDDMLSPHIVKAVLNSVGDALYFSRSLIPFARDPYTAPTYYRHLGIYGFRRGVLLQVTELPPSPLEIAESLEQLRWLEAGFAIRCAVVESRSRGVDLPSDVDEILQVGNFR